MYAHTRNLFKLMQARAPLSMDTPKPAPTAVPHTPLLAPVAVLPEDALLAKPDCTADLAPAFEVPTTTPLPAVAEPGLVVLPEAALAGVLQPSLHAPAQEFNSDGAVYRKPRGGCVLYIWTSPQDRAPNGGRVVCELGPGVFR